MGASLLLLGFEKTREIWSETTPATFCRQTLRNASRMAQRLELCSTDEVADGAAIKVEAGDLVLAVFNLEGQFYVLDDTCSHGPGSLSEGYIEGDNIECPFHQGQFNIRTGEVAMPPCMVAQKTYTVTIENGKVLIEV
jgi:nitrite reductase/ring-hydroxylating ferredoxin subunit